MKRSASLLALVAATMLLGAAVAWAAGTLSAKAGRANCVGYSIGGIVCRPGRAIAGTEEVAQSPDGRNLYVVGYGANGVATFRRNPMTGALSQQGSAAGCVSADPKAPKNRPCRSGRALDDSQHVVVSPDGKNVYVASFDSSAVSIFDRDSATGALTQKAGAAGCVSASGTDGDGGSCERAASLLGPLGVAISPDGRSVYVNSKGSLDPRQPVDPIGRSVSVFDRDPGTGDLVQKPGAEGCLSGGRAGAACTPVLGMGLPLKVLVSRDSKSVYVTSSAPDSVAILDRDPATGVLTQKQGPVGCISEDGTEGRCRRDTVIEDPNGIASSPDGKSLYVTNEGSSAVAIFDRDPATGALTQKPGPVACVASAGKARGCKHGRAIVRANGVTVSSDGRSVYVRGYSAGSTLAIFDRDRATGALSQDNSAAVCLSQTSGPCQRARTLAGTGNLLVSADGRSLYVPSLYGVAIFNRAKR